MRIMHEGARDGDFHSLALGEALGAAIGQLAQSQLRDQRVDPRLQQAAGKAMQGAVIANVLARREPLVQAAGIGEHTDAAPDRHAVPHHVVAVDERSARVRREQRGQHAQQGRLACAVGTEQARDASIRRDQVHLLHGVNLLALAEGLADALDGDHDAGPSRSTKNGGRFVVVRQPASSFAAVPARTNSATRRGAQPCGVTRCP